MRNLFVRRLAAALTPIVYLCYAACGGGGEDEALKAAKAAGDKALAEANAKLAAAGQLHDSNVQRFNAALAQAQALLKACTEQVAQITTLASSNGNNNNNVALALAMMTGSSSSTPTKLPAGTGGASDPAAEAAANLAISQAEATCHDKKQQALLLLKSAPVPCGPDHPTGVCDGAAINDPFWSQYIASVMGPFLLQQAAAVGMSPAQVTQLQSQLGGLNQLATMLSGSGLPPTTITSIMQLMAGQLAKAPASTTTPVVITTGSGGSLPTGNFNLGSTSGATTTGTSGGTTSITTLSGTKAAVLPTHKADVSQNASADALTYQSSVPSQQLISVDELRRAARAGFASATTKPIPAPAR